MNAQVNIPFEKVVAGVLHVDDLAVFSKVWCARCLASKVQQTFPSDLGFTVEAEGPTLKILRFILDVDEDSRLRFFPANANIWYGLGHDSEQPIARQGVFYSAGVQRYSKFAMFLIGQVLMYYR